MVNSRYNRMSLSVTVSNPLLRHLLKHFNLHERDDERGQTAQMESATALSDLIAI